MASECRSEPESECALGKHSGSPLELGRKSACDSEWQSASLTALPSRWRWAWRWVRPAQLQ